MARSIRIQYPGAYYHVMARGNRREAIYRDDEDRQLFLQTLGEACGMTGWRVHAWVLMGNHYHLCVETPEANLVNGMQWLQNTYTRRFNSRHRAWGRLFGDRYKAVLVEGVGEYYQVLLNYIHLNPVRAGMIKPRAGESIKDYPWSSVARGYAILPSQRPLWMAAAAGLESFGWPDTAAGRRRMVEHLDRGEVEGELARAGIPLLSPEVDQRMSHLRRGWYWGSQAFAERVLELGRKTMAKQRHRSSRSAGESKAHGEATAHRLLQEGMEAAALNGEMLQTTPGSEPRKVAIARVIWENTTVSMEWIATRLWMRSAANASQQLRRWKQRKPHLPKRLKLWVSLSGNVV